MTTAGPHLLVVVAVLLLATIITDTTNAFTPDAAFKRAQIHLTLGNDDQKNVYVYTQHNKNRRLGPTVNNLRKSVTTPPSFEEYMATRRRRQKEQLSQLQNIPAESVAELSDSMTEEDDSALR